MQLAKTQYPLIDFLPANCAEMHLDRLLFILDLCNYIILVSP